MIETLIFLSAPITICLLLVGILGYFGNHIITRGIIFIDIALAQIASLGAMIGILIGFSAESMATSIFSLVFTLIIISIPALLKGRDIEIPQEALIGILYGLSLALGIILADKIPGGSNFIKKSLTGNILWVTWTDVMVSFMIFGVIGVLQYLKFDKMILLSKGDTSSFSEKESRMLELLFFISFGTVVVRSVEIGGIFVVFVFLIAPSSIALLFTSDWRKRMIYSWGSGFVGAVIGLIISYNYNLPNGPAIICSLGVLIIIAGIVHKIANSRIKPERG